MSYLRLIFLTIAISTQTGCTAMQNMWNSFTGGDGDAPTQVDDQIGNLPIPGDLSWVDECDTSPKPGTICSVDFQGEHKGAYVVYTGRDGHREKYEIDNAKVVNDALVVGSGPNAGKAYMTACFDATLKEGGRPDVCPAKVECLHFSDDCEFNPPPPPTVADGDSKPAPTSGDRALKAVYGLHDELATFKADVGDRFDRLEAKLDRLGNSSGSSTSSSSATGGASAQEAWTSEPGT